VLDNRTPRRHQEPAQAPALADAAPARRKVLVVEDNDDGRELLCEMIGFLGYEVDGARSAEEALPLLGACHVLLTDISLPGMSGVDLAHLAHREHPGVRIVFASGGARPEVDFPSGAIRKPFSMEQLEAALKG
jgi:CheY-like chemotaxis protein